MYDLVKELIAEGVPIHGVGFQNHLSAEWIPDEQNISSNLKRFTDLGLLVNFSEVDIRMRDVSGTFDEKMEQQKQIYKYLVATCLKNSRCHAFTLWGFTDKHSWVDYFFGEDDPLIFDESYNKKPSYYGIMEALTGQ